MDFRHFAFEFQWEQCFALVDTWKTKMIDQIVAVHHEKSAEIQTHKDRAQQHGLAKIDPLILNLNEYFQHACVLSDEIDSFKSKLIELKQLILHRPLPLQIDIAPSSVNDSIVITPHFGEHTLQRRHVLARYPLGTHSIRFMIASTNQIVLVTDYSQLMLYDKSLGFIDQVDVLEFTDEHLNDACWSATYGNVLFLFEYSLWSLDELQPVKLAHVPSGKHVPSHLAASSNHLFLAYDHGELIDRWTIQPQWKLDKRWRRSDDEHPYISLHANDTHVLLYTKPAIHLCTYDLAIQHAIDLSTCSHVYSHFMFLSSHRVWLTVDQQTQLIHYFRSDDDLVRSLDEISIAAVCVMGDELVLLTADDNNVQIVSIE